MFRCALLGGVIGRRQFKILIDPGFYRSKFHD